MSRVSRGFKNFWRIAKWLFGLFVFLVVALLLWRIFDFAPPSSMEQLHINDSLHAAYEEHGEDIEIFSQEHLTMTADKDSRGYFSVSRVSFIPQANQIQLVLRYNNSTIRHLEEDYSLESAPGREEELFDVSLFFSVDLTPENTEDNDVLSEQGTRTFRCSSERVASDTKGLHNYRMFVFDLEGCGEDLEELIDSGLLLAVYADVYYVEDMDLDGKAYGSIFLYDYASKNVKQGLADEDIENLEAWKKDL